MFASVQIKMSAGAGERIEERGRSWGKNNGRDQVGWLSAYLMPNV